MSNINNNNNQKINFRLINDEYMDFMLSKDTTIPNNKTQFTTFINLNNYNGKNVVSEIAWENSVASQDILKNIGFTGVDNGFITYERDRISNEEFLNIFTKSSFDLSSFNNKFFLTKVDGNANVFKYPIEQINDYVAFKGGFLQGFFKIYGSSYQTLPNKINKQWIFNFSLRKKNYETHLNILNNKHVNNKGIFFFIGIRSENKFWELYKKNENVEDFKDAHTNIDISNIIKEDYISLNCNDTIENCQNDSFFIDDYLQKQLQIDDMELKDTNGNLINENRFYEVETNNKFILFNRAKDGFTTKTWNDDYKYVLTGQTLKHDINFFQYLNNTKNGYNKNNINELIKENSSPYDIFKDIENNALALKINDDGSIGYRYLSNNCEIIEEFSKPNIIELDQWVDIKVIIKRKTSLSDIYKQGIMKLYIYVNGYLKLVSKELPEIILKNLDDSPEKQEIIPYNISIGGGSQGLSERILLNYYDDTEYCLPIEKYFGGTFIGDIKSFSMLTI